MQIQCLFFIPSHSLVVVITWMCNVRKKLKLLIKGWEHSHLRDAFWGFLVNKTEFLSSSFTWQSENNLENKMQCGCEFSFFSQLSTDNKNFSLIFYDKKHGNYKTQIKILFLSSSSSHTHLLLCSCASKFPSKEIFKDDIQFYVCGNNLCP